MKKPQSIMILIVNLPNYPTKSNLKERTGTDTFRPASETKIKNGTLCSDFKHDGLKNVNMQN